MELRTVLPMLRAASEPVVRAKVFHCSSESDAAVRAVAQQHSADVIIVGNVDELLRRTDQATWGCVIAEHPNWEAQAFEELEDLARSRRGLPWILWSADLDWPTAVEAMKRGALDVLHKDTAALAASLSSALRTGRERFLGWAQFTDLQLRFGQLSDSERHVLSLVMRGWTNKEIATQLDCSLRTVESRRQRILRVMQTENAIELAVLLARHGIVNQSDVVPADARPAGPHWISA